MNEFDRVAAQGLLDVLWQLKRGELSAPVSAAAGICHVIYMAAGDRVADFEYLWDDKEAQKAWPEFSGDTSYPVPGGEETYEANSMGSTMWTGEYGAARWRLVNWTIRYWERRLAE